MVTRAIPRALLSALALPVLFLSWNMPCIAQPEQKPAVSPDPKIQNLIRQIIHAEDQDDAVARKAMKLINEMARKMPQVLAAQLVYYDLHTTTEKDGVGIMGLIGQISTTWDSEMRNGLIPLLETSDKKVYLIATGWLSGIDRFHHPGREHNVWFYRDAMSRQKEAPRPGAVDYLFVNAPSTSLLLFGQIHSDDPNPKEATRSLMWSDHIVTTVKWRLENRFVQDGDLQQAQKELDRLSRHDGWYARRYVVQIMHSTPKLAVPEIVSRLAKDANPLVAEPAKLIK